MKNDNVAHYALLINCFHRWKDTSPMGQIKMNFTNYMEISTTNFYTGYTNTGDSIQVALLRHSIRSKLYLSYGVTTSLYIRRILHPKFALDGQRQEFNWSCLLYTSPSPRDGLPISYAVF